MDLEKITVQPQLFWKCIPITNNYIPTEEGPRPKLAYKYFSSCYEALNNKVDIIYSKIL